ncbi:hypothetical protein DRE_01436 [Drechslerella stenobrocha 248]|uniref:GH16 domain-containing protein n=1 Tax=Drechslerella stenobrocha 248 TaxID=1043628 RepID=W7HKL1_9PEZI|nr:hypothetical protein DRE_01436 [Drechslerella stenobrocha 248]
MVRLSALGATALLASTAAANLITRECGEGLGKCPSNKPCCSQYGQCGIGAYCLGGCDPTWSTTVKSCMPAPQCQSKTYKFTDSRSSPILSNTKYLGDPSKADWVSDGQPLFANGVVYLTMAPDTVGTVLSSTRYVWYGKITARMRTSRGAGVVSAFIMMSDVKDEIDYEWVGVDLKTSQTNYYWNGIPDYTHSGNITVDQGNTYSDWHTYTIDWTPESITWSVNGQVGRVKKRSDTYNATSGNWEFPQTPSRVQLSLWPGGLASNGQGTIDWAGGPIKWDGEDVQKNGYYYAQVSEVTVECYNPPGGASGNGKTSYRYADLKAVNTSVILSNDRTDLASFLATGEDPEKEPAAPSSVTKTIISTDAAGKATTVIDTVAPTDTNVGTVPGLNGAGFDSGDLSGGRHNGGSGDANGASNGGTGGTGTNANKAGTTGWSQSDQSTAGGNNSSDAPRLFLLWGNLVAMLLVGAAMTTL